MNCLRRHGRELDEIGRTNFYRSAAFTPLQLAPSNMPQFPPTPFATRTPKRPKGRAPSAIRDERCALLW